MELAKKSVKIVRNINSIEEAGDLEIAAEFEIGNCLLLMALPQKAMPHFELCLELSKIRELHETATDAMVKMSECVQSSKDKYEKILIEAKSFAKDHLLFERASDIFVLLGRYNVSDQNFKPAMNHFEEALAICEKAGLRENLQRIRLLMAPLRGELARY